jgi:hypothetical protein
MYIPFSVFCVLFACVCVLFYCRRMTTQLQLNICIKSYFHALKTDTVLPSTADKYEKQSCILCYVCTDKWNIRILDKKAPPRQLERQHTWGKKPTLLHKPACTDHSSHYQCLPQLISQIICSYITWLHLLCDYTLHSQINTCNHRSYTVYHVTFFHARNFVA